MQQELNPKKHILVFLITLGVFAVIFLLSDFLYNRRITQVKGIEDTINRNILESEIQYALLADASCDTDETGNPVPTWKSSAERMTLRSSVLRNTTRYFKRKTICSCASAPSNAMINPFPSSTSTRMLGTVTTVRKWDMS